MNNTIEEFNYDINVRQAILWQYNQATNINSILNYKQDWLDENYTFFWNNFYDTIFWLWNTRPDGELNSFSDFGCALWAIILGIPLQIVNPPDPDIIPFGFENHLPFDNAPFTDSSNENFIPRDLRILLLKLRYFQLTTRGDVIGINAFLAKVLAGFEGYNGRVYVLDNHDMTITYVFTEPLSAEFSFILDQYDILPRPASVGLLISIEPDSVFGFENHQPFNNGPFIYEP